MQPAAATTKVSLYERLGGAEGIANLVEDIVQAHIENPIIGARFRPYAEDPPRLGELKGHLRSFLAAGTGGANSYSGRSMPDAHRGLNISAAEYMAALDDILDVLGKHDIEAQARQEVLAIAYSLKDDIMGR